VYSLSRADLQRLRAMVMSFVDDSRRLVAPSREEEVAALLIDVFAV
jgi:hypothetical protein